MKRFLIALIVFLLVIIIPERSSGFTKFTDIIFDGESVPIEELSAIFDQIKQNKLENKKIKNPRKKLPTKLSVIEARQPDPKNIQLHIDTSEVLIESQKDVQLPISNTEFLSAIQEALTLLESAELSDIKFSPLKFTKAVPDTDDGINLVTFRAIEPPEGIGEESAVFSIVNYARSETVEFMGESIMVKPGTILDVDVIFDPTNEMCLAYFITQGPFKIGGDRNATQIAGGIDPIDAQNCEGGLGVADITDFAVRGIAKVLGLESSAIGTAAIVRAPQNMVRYALTNDDKIGLANLYPKNSAITNHGTIAGKVIINKKPVLGAHVVLENTVTGEPTAGTFTDLNGEFQIMAAPAGDYLVYAEPLDGRVRPIDFTLNSFASAGSLDFSTLVKSEPVTITNNMTTNVTLESNNHPVAGFNINTQIISPLLTEMDAANGLGVSPLPITIMPGETLSGIKLWGDNITTNFGTVTITGSGVTISNAMDVNVPLSNYFECTECEDSEDKVCKRDSRCAADEEITVEADQIPGIQVDITAAGNAIPGPRTIIFTGDMLDPTHPSFGLRDQITGGLIVAEP